MGLDVKKFFQAWSSRTSLLVTIIWEVIGKRQAQVNLKELFKSNRYFKSASLKMLFVFGCFTVFFFKGMFQILMFVRFRRKNKEYTAVMLERERKTTEIWKQNHTRASGGVQKLETVAWEQHLKKRILRGKKLGHLAWESESDTYNIKIRQRTLESLQNDLFVFGNFSFMFLQISPTLCSFVNIIRTWHCCWSPIVSISQSPRNICFRFLTKNYVLDFWRKFNQKRQILLKMYERQKG